MSPCWIYSMKRWRKRESSGVTKYGCPILSQIVGCKNFSFERKNGLTQTVVSLFFLNMSRIEHKERHFLGQERGCRFGLLSLCIECRLFMQLKLSPSVYCVLTLPTSPLCTTSSIPKGQQSSAMSPWDHKRICCVTHYSFHTTEQGH